MAAPSDDHPEGHEPASAADHVAPRQADAAAKLVGQQREALESIAGTTGYLSDLYRSGGPMADVLAQQSAALSALNLSNGLLGDMSGLTSAAQAFQGAIDTAPLRAVLDQAGWKDLISPSIAANFTTNGLLGDTAGLTSAAQAFQGAIDTAPLRAVLDQAGWKDLIAPSIAANFTTNGLLGDTAGLTSTVQGLYTAGGAWSAVDSLKDLATSGYIAPMLGDLQGFGQSMASAYSIGLTPYHRDSWTTSDSFLANLRMSIDVDSAPTALVEDLSPDDLARELEHAASDPEFAEVVEEVAHDSDVTARVGEALEAAEVGESGNRLALFRPSDYIAFAAYGGAVLLSVEAWLYLRSPELFGFINQTAGTLGVYVSFVARRRR